MRAGTVLFYLLLSPFATAADLIEEFAAGRLEEETWCPCQMAEDMPVRFSGDRSGDHIAHITVTPKIHDNKCGERECAPTSLPRSAAAPGALETPREPLGPSFIRPSDGSLTMMNKKNPYCDDSAGEERCYQRQELRLTSQYWHDIGKPHEYSIRFRMPAFVGDEDASIRWVTAQWKQAPVKYYGMARGGILVHFWPSATTTAFSTSPSRTRTAAALWPRPRCQNRSPSGRTESGGLQIHLPASPRRPAVHAGAGGCLWARSGLDLAAARWTEMRYLVTAGWDNQGVIQVHQDNRLIVEVTGKLGYKPEGGKTSLTRFKIGHYRNYMPFTDTLDIDWVKVSPR